MRSGDLVIVTVLSDDGQAVLDCGRGDQRVDQLDGTVDIGVTARVGVLLGWIHS